MECYYGVTRSPEYLAHYGVKGMKWGVHKALESGNQRAYARHYRKATRKLKRLEANADLATQRKIAQQNGRISKIAGRIGAAGVATMLGATGGNSLLVNAARKTYSKKKMHDNRYHEFDTQLYNNYQRRALKDLEKSGYANDTAEKWKNLYADVSNKHFNLAKATDDKYKQTFDRQLAGARAARHVGNVASIVGGVGLGLSAGSALVARKALKRTTKEGHAKAVAERDAWKREMDRTFKNKPVVKSGTKNNRKKQRKYFTKQDFKNAFKAAGISMIGGPAAGMAYTSRKLAEQPEYKKNKRRKSK